VRKDPNLKRNELDIKEMRHAEAQYKQKEFHLEDRINKISCLNKWENFRESRSYYVNIYLDLKKKQMQVKGILGIIFM
jgi:hypothetical protein